MGGGPAPPGIKPLNFSQKQMEKHDMKTGPGLRDTVAFKVFTKTAIVEEMQAIGFYSAFHEIRADIAATPLEDILVVADREGKYGENWYVCLTEEVKAAEMDTFLAAERAAAEAARLAAEEEERKRAEEAALETIVVHEEPLIARPYSSPSAEATANEVAAERGPGRSRALILLKLTRPRFMFGAPCEFHNRQPDAPVVDIRPRKDETYGRARREMTIGLQACPSALSGRVDAAMQTEKSAATATTVAVQCDVEADALGEAARHPLRAVLNDDAPALLSIARSLHLGVAGSLAAGSAPGGALLAAAAAAANKSPGKGPAPGKDGGAGAGGGGSSVPGGVLDALRHALKEAFTVAEAVAGPDVPGPLPGTGDGDGSGAGEGGAAGGGGGGGAGSPAQKSPGRLAREAFAAAAAGAGGGAGGAGAGAARPALTLGGGSGGSGPFDPVSATPLSAAASTLVRAVRGPMARLHDFLTASLGPVEHALRQNETLDIFQFELAAAMANTGSGGAGAGKAGGEDGSEEADAAAAPAAEAAAASRDGDDDGLTLPPPGQESGVAAIREERQYIDLELTNNQVLSCIEWHPRAPGWLAAAAIPRHSFEQRLAASVLPRTAYVLLYSLAEFTAQIVLEAPSEVTCMHWNPGNTNLVAVGCASGQVALFDLSAASKAKQAAAGEGGEKGAGEPGTSKATRLRPRFVSAVDASHAGTITSLRWLPLANHLNGRMAFAPAADNEVTQFMTAARDGSIAIWDIKFKEKTRKGGRRGSMGGAEAAAAAAAALAAAAAKGGAKGGAAAGAGGEPGAEVLQSNLVPGAAAAGVPPPPLDVPWAPMYRVTMRFGAGPVRIAALTLNDKRPSDPALVASEDGNVMVVDWAPPGEGTGIDDWLNQLHGDGAGGGKGAASRDDDDHAGAGAGAARTLWSTAETAVPPAALCRSPALPDVFLTVWPYSFSLWRRGMRQPLFSSPAPPHAYAAGRWSPTRAAVIFLGRVDGCLEVWDLLDSTTRPVVVLPLISVPITSLEFRGQAAANAAAAAAGLGPAGARQMLAVGDAKGSLHVLDIPPALRRGLGTEDALLAAYLDRETSRAAYVATRAVAHEAERSKSEAEAARMQAERDAEAMRLAAEVAAAAAALADKDPAAAAAVSAETIAAAKKAAARSAAQKAYEALEKELMGQLGIAEEDVQPLDVISNRLAEAEAAERARQLAGRKLAPGTGSIVPRTASPDGRRGGSPSPTRAGAATDSKGAEEPLGKAPTGGIKASTRPLPGAGSSSSGVTLAKAAGGAAGTTSSKGATLGGSSALKSAASSILKSGPGGAAAKR